MTCTACDKQLSCDHGAYDLKKHEKRQPHVDNVGKKNEAEKTVRSQLMKESFKKAEDKTSAQRKVKDAALKAEVVLSNQIATHNIPFSVVDCLAEVLPKIFPDSDIIKQMSLHHCKAQYTLTCGTAPHIKKQLVKQLQKWPFSINYDESVKGKASQLQLNVSYRDSQDRIRRSHLATVKMEVRLTGENISNAVFQAVDELNIPYLNR